MPTETVQPDQPDAESWPNPDNFLQDAYATDADGQPVNTEDPGADLCRFVGRIHNIAYVDPDRRVPCYHETSVAATATELHAVMLGVERIPFGNGMTWSDRKGRLPEQVGEAWTPPYRP